MHTNCVSGKAYVGYTSKTWQKRWQAHVRRSRSLNVQTPFHRALRKYGTSDETWIHRIFDECDDIIQARALERRAIAELRSNVSDYGYNLTEGGEGTCAPKSEEHKSKIRISRKGKCTGHEHPMFNGHPRQKLTVDDVIVIKLSPPNVTHEQLAELFQIRPCHVYSIRTGKSWQHVRPDLNTDPTTFYRRRNK